MISNNRVPRKNSGYNPVMGKLFSMFWVTALDDTCYVLGY